MLLPIILSAMLLSHPDPYHFEKKAPNVQIIIEVAKSHDMDPFELLAIAATESRFNERAVSNTGDYGLFQVNCRVWWKSLGFRSWRSCARLMLDPHINTRSALFIIKHYRFKYKWCRGDRLYSCYNGGPYWKRSKKRDRIRRYRDAVRKRRWRIKRRYSRMVLGALSGEYHLDRKLCLKESKKSSRVSL